MFGTVSSAPEGTFGTTGGGGGGVATATPGIGVGPPGATWPKTPPDRASSTAARQESLSTGLFTYSPYHGQPASPRAGFKSLNHFQKKTAAVSSTVETARH